MESLIEHINAYFKNQLAELETTKENDIKASHSWSNMVALYGLAVNILGVADKRVLKSLQELSKKVRKYILKISVHFMSTFDADRFRYGVLSVIFCHKKS